MNDQIGLAGSGGDESNCNISFDFFLTGGRDSCWGQSWLSSPVSQGSTKSDGTSKWPDLIIFVSGTDSRPAGWRLLLIRG